MPRARSIRIFISCPGLRPHSFAPPIRIDRPQLCQYPNFFSRQAFRRGYILKDFGGEDASYLSQEDFEKLLNGDDEVSLEFGLISWCLVKLV